VPTDHTFTRTPDALDLRREIVGIDQTVPLLDGTVRPYVYLDSAASTPAFASVQRKVNEFLVWYSSVHRGAGFKSIVSTRAYEEAREAVARFVGADPQVDCVIFGKNTTEALNKLAHRLALCDDDVVITTLMEHHSNDLPWRSAAHVERVALGPDGSLDLTDLQRKLYQFRGRTKLVATTGASNVSGWMPPIYDMAELAHGHGARILVDCAQLAPHRRIQMEPADSPRHLDFVTLAAHKMYAPFGTGALIGPKAFFEQGPPDYVGGGTIQLVSLEEVVWADPPERDEAGTPNVIGAVALAASIRRLSDVGMDAVAAHEMGLTRHALRRLAGVKGIRVYGSRDPERLDDRLGVIPITVDGIPHGKVAAILGFEAGIGVRDGCFCAHPYVLRLLAVGDREYGRYRDDVLNRDRSALPGLVRVSFGCYNTEDEVDYLIEWLERIVAGDYCGDYVVDKASGTYVPRQFDPAILGRCFSV
jgi:cysteine desulfurase / selenocysteine lyase